jgi:hypothetical protein
MRLVVGGENGSRIISGICMDRSSVVTLSRMIFVLLLENQPIRMLYPIYEIKWAFPWSNIVQLK